MTLMILELFGQLADSLSAHHLIPASLLDRPVIHLLACDKKMARNLAAAAQVVDNWSVLLCLFSFNAVLSHWWVDKLPGVCLLTSLRDRQQSIPLHFSLFPGGSLWFQPSVPLRMSWYLVFFINCSPWAHRESGERETGHPPTVYMTSGLASHKLARVNMAHLTQLHKALTGERDERMIKWHSFTPKPRELPFKTSYVSSRRKACSCVVKDKE